MFFVDSWERGQATWNCLRPGKQQLELSQIGSQGKNYIEGRLQVPGDLEYTLISWKNGRTWFERNGSLKECKARSHQPGAAFLFTEAPQKSGHHGAKGQAPGFQDAAQGEAWNYLLPLGALHSISLYMQSSICETKEIETNLPPRVSS